jgi:hypothetical protein
MDVKGHGELPSGGHESCPLVATRSARSWPPNVAGARLGQGVHPLAGHGLGKTHAVAAGLADVGVMQEPVDGGGGQRLGHQFVESSGMKVAQCDRAFLVGGVDEAVETFGGVDADGQQPNVIADWVLLAGR